MALSKELHDIAYNLLKTVPKTELSKLLETITHFNDRCIEAQRHDCFENGCSSALPVEQELRATVREVRASQNFYMQTERPSCKCCGK